MVLNSSRCCTCTLPEVVALVFLQANLPFQDGGCFGVSPVQSALPNGGCFGVSPVQSPLPNGGCFGVSPQWRRNCSGRSGHGRYTFPWIFF